MIHSIRHRTIYSYGSTVLLSHHLAHLTPRLAPGQQVLQSRIDITPRPRRLVPGTDHFGNHTLYFQIDEPHTRLVVEAQARVRLEPEDGGGLFPSPDWWQVAETVAAEPDLAEMLMPSPHVPLERVARDYARPSFTPGKPLLDGVRDLSRRIHTDFTFDPTATSIATPLDQVMKHRRGVCQDFAHLMLACLRSLGLPARYVSGYLETLPPPGKPKLQGADASHAWVGVYSPGLGWLDVDPTNDLFPAERHVTLAWGRDFSDVSPLKGVIHGGGSQTVEVGVDVATNNDG
ncbi:MAG: transglutaminase family protein [Alphaproteobacteria bacterium]|nr:transglutaminase family protein [Alphaproteobacteria bacterium]